MRTLRTPGGDGYPGRPTAMRFSSLGHDVHVLDNYLRRSAPTMPPAATP